MGGHKQTQCLVLTTNGYEEENLKKKKWKSKNILKYSPKRKRGLTFKNRASYI
jgi:hypothetical protein